ncbi:MAG: TetR/AcrR family transcriptional regulator [Vicinamibacterales bacterium]
MDHHDAVKSSPRPARGRPRSTAARDKVLAAARALLESSGPGAVTVERLAERAGVGKPTIYRTWPNAQAVLMAALMPDAPARAPAAARDSLAQLRRQLRGLVERLSARSGRSVTLMLAAAEPDSELAKAFRHRVILAGRDEGRRLLQQAVDEGALRRGLDLDVVLDLLYGPIFFRVLVGHGPLDGRFADRVFDHAMKGLAHG